MFHYNLLFDNKLNILLVTFVLIIFFGLLRNNLFFGFRLLLIKYVPFFSVSYYIILLFLNVDNTLLLLSLFFIEFFVLFNIFYLVSKYTSKNRLSSKNNILVYDFNMFYFLLLLRIFILIFLSFQENFGIVSAGSRIEYLFDRTFNVQLTYFNFFLGMFLIAFVLNRVLITKRFDKYFYYLFLFEMVSSIVSGSKGSFILWFISFLAISCEFKIKSIFRYLKLIFFIMLLIIFQIIILKYTMLLNTDEVIKLLFARLYLANDGRALALDYQSNNQDLLFFLINTFRSLSRFFGITSLDPPLGLLLYENVLGLKNLGSNASLTALISHYINDTYEIIIIFMFSITILIIINFILIIINKFFENTKLDGIGYILGIEYIYCYSQDFLAFQVLSYYLLILLFFIVIKKNLIKY